MWPPICCPTEVKAVHGTEDAGSTPPHLEPVLRPWARNPVGTWTDAGLSLAGSTFQLGPLLSWWPVCAASPHLKGETSKRASPWDRGNPCEVFGTGTTSVTLTSSFCCRAGIYSSLCRAFEQTDISLSVALELAS